MEYNPPYFMLVAGLLAGVTSGAAFETTLKQSVNEWSRNRASQSLANMRGLRLFVPFLGICAGTLVFLASGISIFGFPTLPAYGVSFLLTVLTAALVWWQLGQLLMQIEKGGSKAIDLDSFF